MPREILVCPSAYLHGTYCSFYNITLNRYINPEKKKKNEEADLYFVY